MSPPVDPGRLEELFGRALGLEPSSRASWLDRECGDDRELRIELESLLEMAAGPPLPALDSGRAAALLEADIASTVPLGSSIGPFRVTGRLGAGGMATVYLAERVTGGFEQAVAVKVIKRGMDTDAILARFRQERQILAGLQHPGIARLLEGGSTPDGLPYFAMEKVDGVSITSYARGRRLDAEAVMSLFLRVCDAVEHAHQRLVVHRDLKPSNILVTAAGQVKLVDFGIAKVLTEDQDPATATVLGNRALTIDYASPEQLRGETVTTATDIYSLGVVLYELLAGRLPHATTGQTLEQRLLGRDEDLAPLPPLRSANRRSARPEVRLRRDLEAILATALAPRMERRYRSVQAFADDLRRALQAQPILARPPTIPYRLGRFFERHTLGVMLGAGLVLALVLGLIGTTWQGRRAVAERDRAEAHAARAAGVQEFLTSLLQSVDPYRTSGTPWTAAELLDRGVERVDTQGFTDATLEADLLAVLAGVAQSLGQLERAEVLWRRVLALQRNNRAAPSDIAATLRGLARALYSRADHDACRRALEEALLLERTLAPEGPSVGLAATLEQLGVLAHELGQTEEAQGRYEMALSAYRQLGEGHTSAIAGLLLNLGGLEQVSGNFAAAERLQREGIALERVALGPRHPGLAVSLSNLGVTLREQGRYEESEELHREALAISRSAFGDQHPEVATKLSNLAVLLRVRGSYREAGVILRQVLTLDRALLGDDHPYVAFSLDNLGATLAELGEFAEAQSLFSEAKEILIAARGTPSVEVATNLAATGVALRLEGRLEQAVANLLEAQAMLAVLVEPTHPRRVSTAGEIGAALEQLGRVAEAEQQYRDALAQRNHEAPFRVDVLASSIGLARVLSTEQRLDEAADILASADEAARAHLPGDHWLAGSVAVARSRLAAELGQTEEACRLASVALTLLGAHEGVRAEELRREARRLLDPA